MDSKLTANRICAKHGLQFVAVQTYSGPCCHRCLDERDLDGSMSPQWEKQYSECLLTQDGSGKYIFLAPSASSAKIWLRDRETQGDAAIHRMEMLQELAEVKLGIHNEKPL